MPQVARRKASRFLLTLARGKGERPASGLRVRARRRRSDSGRFGQLTPLSCLRPAIGCATRTWTATARITRPSTRCSVGSLKDDASQRLQIHRLRQMGIEPDLLRATADLRPAVPGDGDQQHGITARGGSNGACAPITAYQPACLPVTTQRTATPVAPSRRGARRPTRSARGLFPCFGRPEPW